MISYNDRSNCKHARLYYYDLLDTETEADVPDDARQHIASCQHCQADMSRLETMLADADRNSDSEQRRRDSAVTKLLSLHFAWLDKPVTCKSAKPFLASLADPLLRIRIPTPITVHLDKCRRCSDKLATIKNSGLTHKQLCHLGQTMAEQPAEDLPEQGDSEIVTRFTFREQGDPSIETESDERYAGWPIDVQVLTQVRLENSETAESAGSSAPRKRALILNLKRYAKPAIAAAVILIGFAVLFGTSAAKAVNPDQIRRAVMRASNVHITNSTGGRTKPVQEEWVSRSLSIYMSKIGQELTLWDFRTNPKLVVSSYSEPPKEVRVTEAAAEAARRKIDSPLGIMPFENVSAIPADAKWERVRDDDVDFGTQDWEAYDLIWTDATSPGKPVLERWRVFVDKNDRPQKAQFSRKSPADVEYVVRNELVIEYLSDDDMKTAIEQASL
ncbi:MAG: hypothetical protein AMJ65_12770 [Phycisphaerae bacterium SG8_4]|nr:MAG: hypothetical protein AMJ65_12770 [Phycisphaerae bacterium SG8_4]